MSWFNNEHGEDDHGMELWSPGMAVQRIDAADLQRIRCGDFSGLPGLFAHGRHFPGERSPWALPRTSRSGKCEGPLPNVKVATFAIGQTEVTRGQYAVFVKQTRRPAPANGCFTYRIQQSLPCQRQRYRARANGSTSLVAESRVQTDGRPPGHLHILGGRKRLCRLVRAKDG